LTNSSAARNDFVAADQLLPKLDFSPCIAIP